MSTGTYILGLGIVGMFLATCAFVLVAVAMAKSEAKYQVFAAVALVAGGALSTVGIILYAQVC